MKRINAKDKDIPAELRTAKRHQTIIPKEDLLSSGCTLINLNCTGRTDGAFAKGFYYHLVGDSSSGKAQPLTAKVLTPSGWKKMGNLSVGDAIVDPDGGVAYVEGIFPQGRKAVNRVTFSDGSSTECCDEHLWLVQDTNDKRRGSNRVMSCKDINDRHVKRADTLSRAQIPMTRPVVYKGKRNLPLDPYLLGVLIGNGYLGSPAVRTVALSSGDPELLQKTRRLLPPRHNLKQRNQFDWSITNLRGHRNRVIAAIDDLGLLGSRASTKFIPKTYRRAAPEQRLSLLQGLFDTDGTPSNGSTVEYSTSSKKLCRHVMELVWSLGGRASVTVRPHPKYTYRGEVCTGQTNYRVWVKLPPGMPPFTVTRKAELYSVSKRAEPTRSFMKVEKVGVKECQCIKVSSKRSLYITDDFIVTHNTYFALTCLAEAKINPHFKGYKLIYDPTENGSLFDPQKFWPVLAGEVHPPYGTIENPVTSVTNQDFFDYAVTNMLKGPCIYVLDSEDVLRPVADVEKMEKTRAGRMSARGKGKVLPPETGSYGMAKAKDNTSGFREVTNALAKHGSILLVVSQTRDKPPPPGTPPHMLKYMAADAKTYSGGHALKFYATLQMWTSVHGQIKKKVRDRDREMGIIAKVRLKKNRQVGKDRSCLVRFYHSFGIDDVGSNLEYLIDEGHWKADTKTTVKAPEFKFNGKREDLAAQISGDPDAEKQLRQLVRKVWLDIESQCVIQRTNRYT